LFAGGDIARSALFLAQMTRLIFLGPTNSDAIPGTDLRSWLESVGLRS